MRPGGGILMVLEWPNIMESRADSKGFLASPSSSPREASPVGSTWPAARDIAFWARCKSQAIKALDPGGTAGDQGRRQALEQRGGAGQMWQPPGRATPAGDSPPGPHGGAGSGASGGGARYEIYKVNCSRRTA